MFEAVVPAGHSHWRSPQVRSALIKVAITIALAYQAIQIHSVTGELTRRERLLNARSRALAERERVQFKKMDEFKQRLKRIGVSDETSGEEALSDSSEWKRIAPIQPPSAVRAARHGPHLGAGL